MTMNNKKVLSFIVAIMILMSTNGVFASDFVVTMAYGSRGNEVYKIQNMLHQLGYFNDSIDGIYGLITEKAVIKFQIENNLRIDGIAGEQTQLALSTKANVGTNQQSNTNTNTNINTNTNNNTATNYTDDDLYWLSRIIHAEASGESFTGKVAVGNVILNRVKSSDFPNTIYNVIFEYYGNIPQFSPVAEGTIYNTPSQESIQAAKDALNGARPVGNSTYFFNPDKAAGTWIVSNKTYVTKIGGHAFYA